MHRHIVFNANSSDARHVNPGFDRNHIPCNQEVFLSTRHPGVFMHLKSESVSGAVHEIMVEPVTAQNVSATSTEIPGPAPRPGCAHYTRLRFLHRALPSPLA